MNLSPAFRLSADFAALFGCQLDGVGLIQPTFPAPNNAGWLAVNHADCVAADEQQDDDNT